MAVTSGTVYSGYARSSRLYVSWRQTGQSIDGNYTDISWTAGIAVGGSNEWYTNAVKITSVYINGSKVSSGGTYSSIIGNGTYQKLNGTARIPHGTDGSKSFSISVEGWFYGTGNVSGNATFELTPIPRATIPTLSLDSVELGSPVVISMPRAVSTFYHELTYEIGSVSESIGTNLGTSKEWTPPIELANQIPTSVSGNILINCKTYNSSGTLLGTKPINLGVTVPDEIVPVINDITITEAVLKIDEAFGLFIKTQSQLNVEIDAEGVYGSSVNRYSSTLDGVNYMQQAFTSNVINTAGQLQLKVEVTDSRGRTAEKIEPVEVVDYSMPAILSMEYYYCDSTGARDSAGENTKLIIKYKFASVEENNTRALKLSYKKTTEETYTERAVTLDDWEGTAEVIIAGTDSSVTYEYIAQPSDKINSPEGMRMTTGIVVLSRLAGGKGITLFGEAEEEGFVIKGDEPMKFTSDVALAGTRQHLNYIGVNPIASTEEDTPANWAALGTGHAYISGSGMLNSQPVAYGFLENMVVNKTVVQTFTSWTTGSTRRKWTRAGTTSWNAWIMTLDEVNTADYIVEIGTDGSWDYRKWKSGKIEVWRHISASGLTHTGTVLSWYYRGITYEFPTGLFTEVTECFANGKWGSGLSHATARDYSSDIVSVYFLASSTGDMHGSIYAVGK